MTDMKNNTDLGPTQEKVFAAALKKLQKKSWFKGICLDNFPSESYCQESFEAAVSSVVYKTSMWDDPNFFSGE